MGLPLAWQTFTSLLMPSLSLVLFFGPCAPSGATPPPAPSPATELSFSWVSIIPVFCAWSFLYYLIHLLFAMDIFSFQRGHKLFEGKDSVFPLLGLTVLMALSTQCPPATILHASNSHTDQSNVFSNQEDSISSICLTLSWGHRGASAKQNVHPCFQNLPPSSAALLPTPRALKLLPGISPRTDSLRP